MKTIPQTVLLDEHQIRARVTELANAINRDYKEREITVVGVMSGAVIFLADLIRQLEPPLRVEVVTASSYRGDATRPEKLVIDVGTIPRVTNEHVLLVDDIFDTGHTLTAMTDTISTMRPASLKSVVLLWKASRNETDRRPDYFGFTIPDQFVVGYGLDFDGRFRNLPDIRTIDKTTPLA